MSRHHLTIFLLSWMLILGSLVVLVGTQHVGGPTGFATADTFASNARIDLPADQQWYATGLTYYQDVTLKAKGEICVDDTVCNDPRVLAVTGPVGITCRRMAECAGQDPMPGKHGALIAKWGENGEPFVVGQEQRVKGKGELFLGINDVAPSNNKGVFIVTVEAGSQ